MPLSAWARLHGKAVTLWFGPEPPLPLGSATPTRGSLDYLDLFSENAPWPTAAAHTGVYLMNTGWINHSATDSQIKRVIADLRRRGIALAISRGPLKEPVGCGHLIEGFRVPNDNLVPERRIQRLGGVVEFVALDEPYNFGSVYNGAGSCQWSPEKVAQEIVEYRQELKTIFPNAVVGDIESLWKGMSLDQLKSWLETYRQVTGAYPEFFDFDVDYSLDNWTDQALQMEAYLRDLHIPFGMYYRGDSTDTTDAQWVAHATARYKRYEEEVGGRPDQAIFQSWNTHPLRLLPEDEPDTFTHLIRTYVEGVGLTASDNLSQARVYPNPWRIDRHRNLPVRFDKLPIDTTVKLFTISGTWIQTLTAQDGNTDWLLDNTSGKKVSSGIYLYVITDRDGHQRKGKLAVIR